MAQGQRKPGVLAQLRGQRWRYQHSGKLAVIELAEQQAELLTALVRNRDVVAALEQLPRMTVQFANIPTSGLSVWDGHQWIITLNRRESRSRQRFTLLHEYKHIVDHPSVDWLYRDLPGASALQQAEQAADHFAGCALAPRCRVLSAWNGGLQDPRLLAQHFELPQRVIKRRLLQLGLHVDPTPALLDLAPDPDPGPSPASEGVVA
ncbi:ImmA/IrrE family metallo-endopeptidase [uncultured Nocardioides sp.]|uniref:ImmA/IrrE family metallo-endopeptidase n=1 Tax=uncultured Nocardioides sp. TaxID=198441 RepID=UPI0026224D03|nr:ImmA/IrrE family metallo-endopeptidase [uncultured Nocardioides sp.]